MATYLIDYENVNHGGLAGIESLKEQDRVVLFFGKNTGDLPKETIHLLITSKPEIVFKKMRKIGKNYLDFQLAATLGLLIGNSAESDYFIISGDKDFEKVKDFVEPSRSGVTIKRQTAIVVGKKSAATKIKPQVAPKVTQSLPSLS